MQRSGRSLPHNRPIAPDNVQFYTSRVPDLSESEPRRLQRPNRVWSDRSRAYRANITLGFRGIGARSARNVCLGQRVVVGGNTVL